jgi:hypothetical protein
MATQSSRILFQNVKGLTYSSTKDDYRYYMACLHGLDVDIAGLTETNTCWSHAHLRSDLQQFVRSYYMQSKIAYGSPSDEVDTCPANESYQSGGNLTIATGALASRSNGKPVIDPTGLGRWSGMTLDLSQDRRLSLITAYSVCTGSPNTASLGSSYLREYEFFRQQNFSSPNPRRLFFTDLQNTIRHLQSLGHAILLMLDANSTLESDRSFSDFVSSCGLHDLHSSDPAPSTYLGAENRRIDFMFGCDTVVQNLSRSGSLAYTEGPQSDHRPLFVDLSPELICPPTWSTIRSSNFRDLHTGNPELVEQYNSSMLEYYQQHNMVQRIDDLYNRCSSIPREELRQLLTQWDNDQGRAMQSSEKCLRRPRQKCVWSPELRNSDHQAVLATTSSCVSSG